MITQVVLATGNAHKVAELQAILGPLLPELEIVAYDGPSPIEDGATYAANALIKARAAAERTGLPAIADDSGIEASALDGAPGIHSARFAGTGVDSDNRALLLTRLAGERDRAARFVCAAALVAGGVETVREADWSGVIIDADRGEGGFGYDPLFMPAGSVRTAAELTAAEKNDLSHRARAFRMLATVIAAS